MTMPDAMIIEIPRVTKATRPRIETADMPLNASAALVLMVGYIVTAKHNGMTRENFIKAASNVWDVVDDQIARGV